MWDLITVRSRREIDTQVRPHLSKGDITKSRRKNENTESLFFSISVNYAK